MRYATKDIIDNKDYHFLSTNEKLAGGIEMLSFGGSIAYGLDTPSSDIDIRGFALPTKDDILLSHDFEQVENSSTDTVIYSINKMIALLTACNPNIVEILNVDDNMVFYKGELAKLLLNNADAFLSQRAGHTFGGYASQQLRRLQNNLARHTLAEDIKIEHIKNSIDHAIEDFPNKFAHYETDAIEIKKIKDDNGETHLFANLDMKDVPLKEFKDMIGIINSIVKEYDKLPERSRKKDSKHLSKHMSHLIRLYRMGTEILRGDGVNTYRKDAKELLEIKEGKYLSQDENGEFIVEDTFWEMLDEEQKKFNEAQKITKLPKTADMNKIDEIRKTIAQSILDGYKGISYEELVQHNI